MSRENWTTKSIEKKKHEIVLQLDQGTKLTDLSHQHVIPANTILEWKMKADMIKQIYKKSVFDPSRKNLEWLSTNMFVHKFTSNKPSHQWGIL